MRPAWLFAPAHVERKARGALASNADVVVLDLEDAVPEAGKQLARDALAELKPVRHQGALVVRVNAAATVHCLRDVAAAIAMEADGIMLPKTESAAHIGCLCWAMSQLEAEQGRPGVTELIPLIETARGLAAIDEIRQSDRVRQAVFGSVDYALDLGVTGTIGEEVLRHAQVTMVMASRRSGLLPPIDGVTLDAKDAAVTARDARRARDLGFGGKLAIHPAQVEPIQTAFKSTDDEVRKALEITEAARDAESKGLGAVLVDGRLVDRPVVLRAQRLIASARRTANS